MSEAIRHLILVRHGESEGDVRRSAWQNGEITQSNKLPENEELTSNGIEQSFRAGRWIEERIIKPYNILSFSGCYVSSAIRSEQTAVALELPMSVWQEDHNLDERNRGKIRGLSRYQHQELYPNSYQQMEQQPLHWVPPGGESILEVASRAELFLNSIEGSDTVLAVTHRDWMWAAQLILEELTEGELQEVDTDQIINTQIIHYTSINPETGEQTKEMSWKHSANPTSSDNDQAWYFIKKSCL